MLKSYSVFHASQVDGIPAYKPLAVEEAPWQRPEAADIILKNSGAAVRIGGGRAFYSPGTDHIQSPVAGAAGIGVCRPDAGACRLIFRSMPAISHWIKVTKAMKADSKQTETADALPRVAEAQPA